ncbi:MAG: hypothetical protein M3070_17950 [Actinomycetota bacterium]|nr:hypothetical protein [Actinomycetota bacterium]
MHQHLLHRGGDLDWDDFFAGLGEIGFYDRPQSDMGNSGFAEDETAPDMARYQLATMTKYVTKHGGTP